MLLFENIPAQSKLSAEHNVLLNEAALLASAKRSSANLFPLISNRRIRPKASLSRQPRRLTSDSLRLR